MSSAYVPAQEIILVWVFIIDLHIQLLARDFMDYNLMYQTHIGTWNWLRIDLLYVDAEGLWKNGSRLTHNRVKWYVIPNAE